MTKYLKDDVLYACCLIEYLGRETKNHRKNVIEKLGHNGVKDILQNACVYHCMTFEQASMEIQKKYPIEPGTFDSVKECRFRVPSFSAIGKVYCRLIFGVYENPTEKEIMDIFSSFLSDEISNFNASTYYSCPEYLVQSYEKGKLLD